MTPSLLALIGSLALGAPAAAEVEDGAQPQAQMEAQALLNLKVKRGDKTLKHPGHLIEFGESYEIVVRKDDHEHVVTVFIDAIEGGFKLEVAYTDNNALVLSGETTAKAKQWVKIKSDTGKAWVELQVDPSKKRPDGVDMPDGDNPLDGL